MKLGKLAAVRDPRTYALGSALNSRVKTVPFSLCHAELIKFPMWANDELSDCALVSAHSAIMTMTAEQSVPHVATTDMVIQDYSDVTGYDPNNAASDRGTVALYMLEHWRKEGLSRFGRQEGDTRDFLTAYGTVPTGDVNAICRAIAYLGGVLIGLQLPNSIVNDLPDEWMATNANGGIAGGHMVWARGYNSRGVIASSWGKSILIGWRFIDAFADEIYGLVSRQNWLKPSGLSVMNEDFDSLIAELKAAAT
jgi:hypothetical protein